MAFIMFRHLESGIWAEDNIHGCVGLSLQATNDWRRLRTLTSRIIWRLLRVWDRAESSLAESSHPGNLHIDKICHELGLRHHSICIYIQRGSFRRLCLENKQPEAQKATLQRLLLGSPVAMPLLHLSSWTSESWLKSTPILKGIFDFTSGWE